jgi:uncharacterized protein YndB with AHSA1/START domain
MPGLAIEREVLIEAPAEVVWRTITEPGRTSRGGDRRSTDPSRPRASSGLVFA